MARWNVNVLLFMGMSCCIEAETEEEARNIAEAITAEEPLESFECYDTDYDLEECTEENGWYYPEDIEVYQPNYLKA